MTLQEYQTALHALYRGDGNTPTDGSTKWDHRENLLAAAINLWESQNILWNELWGNLADAADGDKTAASSDLEYDMPTNFKFLGSYVRTTNAAGKHQYYTVIKPEDAELYKNKSVKSVFVTGNKSAGHVLNFVAQPTAGDTINYPYYKAATAPTVTTDVIEMSDPYFCVYFALAKLHEQGGAGDMASLAYSMADQKLSQMKTRNMMLPHDQKNAAHDRDYRRGVSGFGGSGNWGVSRYGDQL